MSAVSSLVVNDVFKNTLLKDAKQRTNVDCYISTNPIIRVKLRLACRSITVTSPERALKALGSIVAVNSGIKNTVSLLLGTLRQTSYTQT